MSDKKSRADIEVLLLECKVPCATVDLEVCSTPCSPTSSKFFGAPYTPVDFRWPTDSDGKPLWFVGQINMQELTTQAPRVADALPPAGMLQFFMAEGEFVEPYRQDNWRVVWHTGVDLDAHRPHPNAPIEKRRTRLELSLLRLGIAMDRIPGEQRVRFADGWSIPDFDLLLDEFQERRIEQAGRIASYYRLARKYERGGKVLGYANAIQSDPRIDALIGAVQNSETLSPIERGELIRRHLDDWQLLWQISGLRYPRAMAIAGYYLVIRRADLIAGKLGEALVVSDFD